VRVHELLAAGTTRSFEFFPPKSDEESLVLEATLADLEQLHPSFVSVTYRGGRESRQRTYDLVTRIQRGGHITAMAHLICVGHTRSEIRDVLKNYSDAGVQNVMALGGDIPDDPDLLASEFAHAIDLVDLATDRYYLAQKLERADFAVTQFFFQAQEWTRLVEDLAERVHS
jgi:methylenetetrahydrofolate reductase (NADPH)